MHYAIKCSSEIKVKFLLQFGSNPNVLNEEGKSPCHLATEIQSISLLSILFEYHADPNFMRKQEPYFSPLHLAVKQQSKETIEMLLNNGAKIDLADDLGNTPLHYASLMNNSEILKCFCNVNPTAINWNIQNNLKETPLMCSIKHNFIEQAKTIIKIYCETYDDPKPLLVAKD